MLSKTERNILKDVIKKYDYLLELLLEKNRLDQEFKKKRLHGKKLKDRIELSKDIDKTVEDLKTYFNGFSDSYKRVFKHRIKKKANFMIEDLFLISRIYEKLGLFDKKLTILRLFPYDKNIKLDFKEDRHDLFKVDLVYRKLSDLTGDIVVNFK